MSCGLARPEWSTGAFLFRRILGQPPPSCLSIAPLWSDQVPMIGTMSLCQHLSPLAYLAIVSLHRPLEVLHLHFSMVRSSTMPVAYKILPPSVDLPAST